LQATNFAGKFPPRPFLRGASVLSDLSRQLASHPASPFRQDQ